MSVTTCRGVALAAFTWSRSAECCSSLQATGLWGASGRAARLCGRPADCCPTPALAAHLPDTWQSHCALETPAARTNQQLLAHSQSLTYASWSQTVLGFQRNSFSKVQPQDCCLDPAELGSQGRDGMHQQLLSSHLMWCQVHPVMVYSQLCLFLAEEVCSPSFGYLSFDFSAGLRAPECLRNAFPTKRSSLQGGH